MISPETIKKLNERPEFKELITHILDEIRKVNTLEDLPGSKLEGLHEPVPMAIELRARLIATERLASIVAPLIDVQSARGASGGNKDYVV